MPWTDKPGGNGSGSNGNGGGERGPWGQPPRGNNNGSGNNNNGGGNQAPDLEELLRSGRERFRQSMGGNRNSGGGGGNVTMPSGKMFIIGLLVIAGIWVFSGIYQVQPGSQGIVTTFGKYTSISGPGLNWHVPFPVQDVEIVDVEQDNVIQIGGTSRNGINEGSMLTSDENIIDVEISVNWEIKSDADNGAGELPNAAKYAFNVEEPEQLIKAAAEASLREVVGANEFEPIITRGRAIVPQETQRLLQEALDTYESGVQIIRVNYTNANPPSEVIASQTDVVDAGSDAEQEINRAIGYANEKVPVARGEAQQKVLDAEAYAARVVAEARGQASRFDNIYSEYAKAPEVTRQRMYLETVEAVIGDIDKIVIDDDAGGTVPYLSLNELTRRSTSN